MEPKNTVLDDICAEIGYTATTALVAWYGGTVIYIPRVANTDHPSPPDEPPPQAA